MSTVVMSKKRFIQWVGEQLDEDKIILVSTDKSGSITYVKKRNAKSVQFDFAADSFVSTDIRDLAFECPTFCVAVCRPDHLTQETNDMVQIGDKKYLKK